MVAVEKRFGKQVSVDLNQIFVQKQQNNTQKKKVTRVINMSVKRPDYSKSKDLGR